MKNSIPLAPFSVLFIALLATSCEVYSGGGYPSYGGGSGYAGGYSHRSSPSTYGRYAPVSHPYGYRSGYRGYSGRDSSCRSGHSYSSHRGHGSSHSSSHKSSCGSGKVDTKHLRIVGGSTGSKVRPKGAHSLSWYKSRGYNTSKLAFKDSRGHSYKKSGGSSRKSSSKKCSHSSKSKHKSSSKSKSKKKKKH